MYLKAYDKGCQNCSSYLIGDDQTATAVVVNPQRDIDSYLADARRHGWTIRHVFITQRQPDPENGYQKLRERTGALIHRGALPRNIPGFIPHADGDSLTLGSIRFKILESHSKGADAIALLVFDLERDPERPCALLGNVD